ncbi:MAG: RNA polymerase sigma factor [Pseudomonadota bacterium]|nr:RNA polymerase sigma factor [Pseudomonadota bacterium]
MPGTDGEGPPPSDAELVSRAAGGERGAFDVLMTRHAGRVIRFARANLGSASEADDIAQESFVALHRNLHRYDPARVFETWLFAIVRNKIRDHHRRRAVLRWVGAEPDFSGLPTDEPGPERQAADRDDLRRAGELLARLPEGLRTPLLLSAVEGMSLAEIGTVMGLSAKAVEVRVYRARKALKAQFDDEGKDSR